MKKPNFLIVGAPKAGTTSIASYLGQHPDIFISKEKEPFYFIADSISKINKEDPMLDSILKKAHLSPEKYYGLFNEANNETKLGEATVHYLYHYNEVIPKVKKELGDVKIIIILRDPASRAFSNYSFQRRGQFNSFEDALNLENERKERGFNSFWYYKEVGNYYLPVKFYLENFSEVYVGLYEDFADNPSKFIKDLFNFLEVNPDFKPDFKVRHNSTMVPKNKWMHLIIYLKHKYGLRLNISRIVGKNLRQKIYKKNKSTIKPETLSQLKNYFKKDIKKLEFLINKDLSSWYE